MLLDDDGYIVAIDNDTTWIQEFIPYIGYLEFPRCGKFTYLDTPIHFMYDYFDKTVVCDH